MTKKDIILLVILITGLAAGWYFPFFFQPTMTEISLVEINIEQTETNITNVTNRILAIEPRRQEALLQQLLLAPYAEEELYQIFDLPYTVRRVQAILYPFVNDLQLNIHSIAALSISGETIPLWRSSIQLTFVATYADLLTILDAFAQENKHNVIISYSMNLVSDEDDPVDVFNINMLVDYLTVLPQMSLITDQERQALIDQLELEAELAAELETEGEPTEIL